MSKPKIGIFSFACCAGCQFEILYSEKLLEIADKVNIEHFPMAQEKNGQGPFDVAFVEGTITTDEDIKEIQEIRAKSKFLVALGSSACFGGIPALKNLLDNKDIERTVYGKTGFVEQLDKYLEMDAYVKVDYNMYGCPIDQNEFAEVVTSLLMGKVPKEKDYSVCVECRAKENVCLLEAGQPCLGPLTNAGCDALCPSRGVYCEGCRGPVDDANIGAEISLLEKKGLVEKEIKQRLLKFSAGRGRREECRKEGDEKKEK